MRLARSLTLVVLALGLTVTSARASSLVYDNGAINDTFGWELNNGFSVTDSFSLASDTTLDSATVGLWVFPGDTPTNVAWSIGTTAFGTDVASGTSAFTNTFQFTNGFGYDIYSSMFALSGTVAGGTPYWLTLSNGTTAKQDLLFWDDNSGPSSAIDKFDGPVGSEAFTLNGSPTTAAPVPEPASLTLLGLGLVGMGAKRWRQRKAS